MAGIIGFVTQTLTPMSNPKRGFVYYLKDYTAPKVFDGDRFICLLTEQIIEASTKISVDTKTHIKDWVFEVSRKERFKFL
jgi:hypothetical protein